MKSTFFTLITAVLFITSCDKIEKEDFLQGGSSGSVDTSTIAKKVLIEDFTGYKCNNCPQAAAELHAIESLFEGKIVGIGIHVGFFATPSGNFTTDFRTESGNELDQIFDASNNGLPIGMVNRRGYPNAVLSQYTEWASMIPDILDEPATVALKLSESNNQITVEAKKLTEISGNLKLVLCITEDNIIDKQVDGSTLIEEYEHDHVLRTHLNGTWGSYITLENEYTSFNYDFSIENNWVRSNCNIVAYVYNDSNKEVLQVEKLHLTD